MLLTIEDGALVARTGVLHTGPTTVRRITSPADVLALIDQGADLYCSSAVDFPEDSTDDPAVIALCHAIRG